ncbi:MAG: hypothetical protein ACOVN5_04675 [Aquidulcibacter sp.]|jgi:hypothetical protein
MLFPSKFVFVFGGLDFRVGPAVDTKLLVGNQVFFFGQVLVDLGFLWPEVQVVGKNTGPWVAVPEERAVGVAIAFHLNFTIKAPQRAHL